MEMLNQQISKFYINNFIYLISNFFRTINVQLKQVKIYLFDKYEYYIDYIDEKTNDETVDNSLDEEKDIKPEQTDDEIERRKFK